MAKSIFHAQDRQELLERIGRLTPTSERQWGKMTAPRMVCHLIDSLLVATEQAPAKSKEHFMRNPLVRWFVIYLMPWPKGKAPTAPEMLMTQPSEWTADITRLREQLNSAAARGPDGQWAEHPAFGALNGRQYGHLIFKHFNHHLTQFGV